MTGQIERITLESLLSDNYYNQDYQDVPEEPAEVVLECMDILSELNELEQNMIALEAGKAIKKAKSASRKKKIIKSKMKAKDAKTKKAGGKVIRIVKESDADLDGGIGPQPTTTDTMGMSDTDLDADPEAKVQVTEIVDSVSDESFIVGMEGVDFIVEYEDETIVKMEATFKENLKAFGVKVVEFLKKVGIFFVSIFKKLTQAFQNIDTLISKNENAIAAGLNSDKEISTKYTLKGVAEVGKLASDITIAITDIQKTPEMDRAKITELSEHTVFNTVDSGKAKLKDCGFKTPKDLRDVAGKVAQSTWKGAHDTAMSMIKSQENIAKAAISKDDNNAKEQLRNVHKAANNVRKIVAIGYKTYGKASALAMKVARAAIGA